MAREQMSKQASNGNSGTNATDLEILAGTLTMLQEHFSRLVATRPPVLAILGSRNLGASHDNTVTNLLEYTSKLDIYYQLVISYAAHKARTVLQTSRHAQVPEAYKAHLGSRELAVIPKILCVSVPYILSNFVLFTLSLQYTIDMNTANYATTEKWVVESLAKCQQSFSRTLYLEVIGEAGRIHNHTAPDHGRRVSAKLLTSLDDLAKFRDICSGALNKLFKDRLQRLDLERRKQVVASSGQAALAKLDYATVASSMLAKPLTTEEEEIGLAYGFLRASNFDLWVALEALCAAAKDRLKKLEKHNTAEEADTTGFEKENWIVPNATRYGAGPGAWKDLFFYVVGPWKK